MALLPNIVIPVTEHTECHGWAAALLQGVKAAGTKPLHSPTEGWSQAGIWAQRCCLQEPGRMPELAALNSLVEISLRGRNPHFLASKENTQVWQQINFFLKEELHRWTHNPDSSSPGICSKTLPQQWTTDWLGNISWCNSRQRPCILTVRREQI